MSKEEKMFKIRELFTEIDDKYRLLLFFDFDSENMLDEKIEVFEKLAKGIKPIDIDNYYDILENYPKEKIWDIK